jgi:ribosomal protein S7
LGVNFRARRANDFTGAGLRSKEVDAEAGEKNELQQADRLVRELVDAFTKDAAGAVGDREKKEQRAKLAAALRELAKAL